ncbi:hypothetical protein DNU06_13630 [Putridiphycobacter roseus]|uniref:Alpha-2-macroglobulin domain-containing protein n=1 Tax=Putridiphycobacter roseus TaxID=2219161 RepID=A0A2W1MW71_9FLAO|nr:alpha-2-macroglobulin family protein [Putridiphycobacter roseus]PZE16349.1 hypothetical protein DNU06_13630 [Putridiphycobacter roseus]
MKLLQLKFIALFLFICSMNTVHSQTNFNERWLNIDALEKQGLYRKALIEVDILLVLANKELATNHIIRGIFYQLKFNQHITEDDYILGIANVNKQLRATDDKTAAILHGLLAEIYFGYYNRNRWKINQRTVLADEIKAGDIRTWDATQFAKKIIAHYQISLKDQELLYQSNLIDFKEILSSYNTKSLEKLTLYDFLFERAFNFFSQNSFNIDGPAETFNLNHVNYFKSNQQFIDLPIQTNDSFNLKYYAVELLQARSKYFLNKNLPKQRFEVQLKRLKYAKTHSTLSNATELYEAAIKTMTLNYKDYEFVGEAWFELATIFTEQAATIHIKTATAKEKRKLQEAVAICREVIKRAPQSIGASQCKALLSQIQQKYIEISTEIAYLPNVKNLCFITYQNVAAVYLKIYPAPTTRLNRDKLKRYLEKTNTVFDSLLTLNGSEDYLKHSAEFALPALPLGSYMAVISSSDDLNNENEGMAYTSFWVTQMTFQTKIKDNKMEVLSICRKVGHPLENVEVKVKYEEYNRALRKNIEKTVGTYKSDKNGKVTVVGLNNYKSYYVSLKSGKDSYEPKNTIYYYQRNTPSDPGNSVAFFTDRKLYRPGQTIYFKGIATTFKNGKNKLLPDFKTFVEFLDVNQQVIKKVDVVTNEFGSFEGKFTAPYGALTGSMRIQNHYGSTNVQVEEYKRPKFKANILAIEGEYQLNDSIPVKGNAAAFAGNKITDAKVVYRVQRTARYSYWRWWYRPSVSKEICNGESMTNAQGEFSFNFKALADESIDPKTLPIFNYTITVDIIDINGETHSDTRIFSLGYQSLLLSNNIQKTINNQKEASFKIEASSLNGEPLNVKGTYQIEQLVTPKQTYISRYWDTPDQQNYNENTFRKMFPTYAYDSETDFKNWKVEGMQQRGEFETSKMDEFSFDNLIKWKSGYYKYTATTQDKNGLTITDEVYFNLYNPSAKKPIANEVFHVTLLNKTVKPGEMAQVLLSTSEKHLNVFVGTDLKGKTIKEEWIHLKNEQKLIEIPVGEKHIGGFSLDLIVLKNNRIYSQSLQVLVPEPAHHLSISMESFRDKLLPGQEETWTFVIKNASNEKVKSELLASLYDASLDELFNTNDFNLTLYKPYYYSANWSASIGFGKQSGGNVNYNWNDYVSMPYHSFPQLNYFGFNVYGYYGGVSRFSKSSVMMDSDSGSPELETVEMMDDHAKRKEAPIPPVVAAAVKQLEAPNEEDKAPVIKETENETTPLQVRKNFNETAFFYPQLHTNEAGEIRIKFTMPESLTKWKLIGLAHSTTLEIGQIEKELLTQKDLMVMPNMPRFLRETDTISLSTKISNLLNENISGAVSLKLFDPITDEEITNKFQVFKEVQNFYIAPNGNAQVSWQLKIPDTYSAVKYQIVANTEKHSDGEENVLPILSNRMLVTESMPMPMHGVGSKTFIFKKLKNQQSTTLKQHNLSLEFTSNPAWYALQAMPYMMEYPYECAEQTFTRYYANAIATHVLNSKPRIKSVIEAWGEDSPDAFLSKLNKNEELKALLIAETPWVMNANSETETKKNLSILLDINRMDGELNKALSKTIQAQSSNGGWAWFPGMLENRYITQHIVTSLGHLDVLGIQAIKSDKKVRNMVEKGVRFLDEEIVKDFENLKKHHGETYLKTNHLGYVQIQYLYMRSYFPEINLNKKTEEAVLYYKAQAEKYWLSYNVYAKGMIGLAAKRMEMDVLASSIYKSLKDNAIVHEEFGMYWKSYATGYYWYQAPIETQALMIEFFNEMADQSAVEQLKMWLLKEKQTTHWKTTKQTSEAVYALLLNGIDLLASEDLVDITVGGQALKYVSKTPTSPYEVVAEAGTGYVKTAWQTDEISASMGEVKVTKSNKGPAWGAMYWQYFEDLDKITFHETPLKLSKQLYRVEWTNKGEKLVLITNAAPIKVGDKIRVRIELRSDRNLEYVHMKDMRAAGFEPINVISSYHYQGGLGYYQATKDAATNFFFDYIPKGTYVFEYDLRAEQLGSFSNGIATIQCMYAPEFTAHAEGIRVNIKK